MKLAAKRLHGRIAPWVLARVATAFPWRGGCFGRFALHFVCDVPAPNPHLRELHGFGRRDGETELCELTHVVIDSAYEVGDRRVRAYWPVKGHAQKSQLSITP